jgi:tRNA (cytidine/uridine-2'-O-)-methyltransferase
VPPDTQRGKSESDEIARPAELTQMFHIVLFEPQIPANTGNIIRLCANTGATLHLVKPLGFFLDDKLLRRAGLDYHELASVRVHSDISECVNQPESARRFAVTTRGLVRYDEVSYCGGDVFVFGSETWGLPAEVIGTFAADRTIRLPMQPGCRSMNLANAVAVVLYEAWRQTGFATSSEQAPTASGRL